MIQECDVAFVVLRRLGAEFVWQDVIAQRMVGDEPPGCSDDKPHAKWLRDPENQPLFESSKISDAPISKEN
jgi:hypothetical protein